jgi:hypothetical protein
MQQGMLFHDLAAPHSGVNIEQMLCSLHEELNVPVFRRAWEQVMRRHAVLRTSFHWQGLKEPVQEVHAQVELPLAEEDWRGLPEAEQARRLRQFLDEDRRRGFELDHAPLMRLTLFRKQEADYECVWSFNHVVLDGRSFAPVLKEAFTFYDELCEGHEPELELPRPYRDYIQWLQGLDLAQAEAFWRQTLQGAPPSPLLSRQSGSATAAEGQPGHSTHELRLSTTVTRVLQALAQKHDFTLNTILQGAWALLLSRYSGAADVIFGATRACRRSTVPGADEMVGVFINTLPVRVRVPADRELIPWLQELRAQQRAVRPYEHTPLFHIQQWAGGGHGQPLFESILVYEEYLLNSLLRAQGGKWERREFRLLEQTNYPLTVYGYLDGDLLLRLACDRQHFSDATTGQMLRHLRTLLEGIAADPHQRLRDIPMLTAAEARQLVRGWNDTTTPYPQDRCIHQFFEDQLARLAQTPPVQAAHSLARALDRTLTAIKVGLLIHFESAVELADGLIGLC